MKKWNVEKVKKWKNLALGPGRDGSHGLFCFRGEGGPMPGQYPPPPSPPDPPRPPSPFSTKRTTEKVKKWKSEKSEKVKKWESEKVRGGPPKMWHPYKGSWAHPLQNLQSGGGHARIPYRGVTFWGVPPSLFHFFHFFTFSLFSLFHFFTFSLPGLVAVRWGGSSYYGGLGVITLWHPVSRPFTGRSRSSSDDMACSAWVVDAGLFRPPGRPSGFCRPEAREFFTFHYFAFSLFHYFLFFTISLFHYFHFFTFSLLHFFTIFTFSLFHFFTIFTFSLFHYFTFSRLP